MAVSNERTVVVFGGTGFFAAASSDISANAGFLFGLLRGIRIGVMRCLLSVIRNFNRLQRIFTMNNRSRGRLLVHTLW